MIDKALLSALRGLLPDNRGVAFVEFAVTAPIVVLLYLGTIEATSAVRAYLKFNAAVQTYADLIANQDSITKASLGNYCAGAALVMTGLNTSTLSIAAASVSNKSGAISQDWHDTSQCGTGVASIVGTTIANNLTPNDGDSAIAVQGRYTYTSFLHYVLPLTQTFSQTAAARPRDNATIPCSDCTKN